MVESGGNQLGVFGDAELESPVVGGDVPGADSGQPGPIVTARASRHARDDRPAADDLHEPWPVIVPSRWSRGVVRVFDLAIAIPSIALLAPLAALIMLLIRITSGPGVLFRQSRIGRHGSSFVCLKFRTMVPEAEEQLPTLLAADHALAEQYHDLFKLTEDPRVTRIGRVLRRSSLDELPQLINVVRGDMSVVGPRPMIPEETGKYGLALPQVLEVKPGLTGLWQVSGRSDLSYEERVDLDTRYSVSRTLRSDLVLCVRTVFLLLRSTAGAY